MDISNAASMNDSVDGVESTTAAPPSINRITPDSWFTVGLCYFFYFVLMTYVIGPLKPFIRWIRRTIQARRNKDERARSGGSQQSQDEEPPITADEMQEFMSKDPRSRYRYMGVFSYSPERLKRAILKARKEKASGCVEASMAAQFCPPDIEGRPQVPSSAMKARIRQPTMEGEFSDSKDGVNVIFSRSRVECGINEYGFAVEPPFIGEDDDVAPEVTPDHPPEDRHRAGGAARQKDDKISSTGPQLLTLVNHGHGHVISRGDIDNGFDTDGEGSAGDDLSAEGGRTSKKIICVKRAGTDLAVRKRNMGRAVFTNIPLFH